MEQIEKDYYRKLERFATDSKFLKENITDPDIGCNIQKFIIYLKDKVNDLEARIVEIEKRR